MNNDIKEKFIFFLNHYKGYRPEEIANALNVSKKKINKIIMKFNKLEESEIIFFEDFWNGLWKQIGYPMKKLNEIIVIFDKINLEMEK
jgi:orotate phosphoribosyltransferase-like protein